MRPTILTFRNLNHKSAVKAAGAPSLFRKADAVRQSLAPDLAVYVETLIDDLLADVTTFEVGGAR